jgi:hypothetical protein
MKHQLSEKPTAAISITYKEDESSRLYLSTHLPQGVERWTVCTPSSIKVFVTLATQ